MNAVIDAVAVDRLAADVLVVLREHTANPHLSFAAPPRVLTGGFWAELLAFRVDDAPDGWPAELVVRVMPDPVVAAKETAVQGAVAAQGFPTPAVRLAGGPDAGLGRAFMVMDLADGAPLLAGLGGSTTVAALPRLLRRLPDVLASTMAALHRLDTAPVRARLVASGTPVVDIPGLLTGLAESARACGRADLVAVAQWLRAHPPAPEPDVICHGDLHPFNVLVADDGRVTVLDWSAAVLAPAAYDVAFTSLLLAEPPITAAAPVRAALRGVGALLAHRFRRRYERATGPVSPQSLRWHTALVCLRALVQVASWSRGLDEHRGHPWLLSGPAIAARLARITATAVDAR